MLTGVCRCIRGIIGGGVFAASSRRTWRLARRPAGVYLHGSVGSGKSLLMDLLFASVAQRGVVPHRRRLHFNAAMLELHRCHAMPCGCRGLTGLSGSPQMCGVVHARPQRDRQTQHRSRSRALPRTPPAPHVGCAQSDLAGMPPLQPHACHRAAPRGARAGADGCICSSGGGAAATQRAQPDGSRCAAGARGRRGTRNGG